VSVAIDQWYHRRQKDAEGDFYRKIAGQSSQNNFDSTTQGLFLAGADGKLLGFTNHRSPERVKAVLKDGLARFTPAEAELLVNAKPDPNFSYKVPDGGLVLNVTSKVLAGQDVSVSKDLTMFNESMGRDVLWTRKDENDALARGVFPESLKRRMALYTLIDNTRGEPHPWDATEVRKFEATIKDGILTGTVHIETAKGDRGYKAELRGVVEAKDGKLTRLDLIARGDAWGASGCTEVAKPKDKFTLAVAYRIATGRDEADKVMPQGAKAWFPEYMK
jgi:hypothetical protein